MFFTSDSVRYGLAVGKNMEKNSFLNGVKMVPCPECHARVRIYASYCYNCGSKLDGVEILDLPFSFPLSMNNVSIIE